MPGKISIEELTIETRKKLKLEAKAVQPKIIVLGKLLQDVQGLTNREALWALRTAITHVRGYKKDKYHA